MQCFNPACLRQPPPLQNLLETKPLFKEYQNNSMEYKRIFEEQHEKLLCTEAPNRPYNQSQNLRRYTLKAWSESSIIKP